MSDDVQAFHLRSEGFWTDNAPDVPASEWYARCTAGVLHDPQGESVVCLCGLDTKERPDGLYESDGLAVGHLPCVVSSPPYWGLRDYGTATWVGGDEACDHRNGPLASPKSTLMGYTGPDVKLATGGMPFKGTCGKCGATRQDSQLGLEHTPEEYVANMVAVFREVRRVLRPDGTVWLNLGDSYTSGGTTGRNDADTIRAVDAASGRRPNAMSYGDNDRGGRAPRPSSGLAQKQLVGIPWRTAFALQADGWYLRSDIIWAKPNPMPESVTDRPTKAHEYLFLLSKSPRYYFDAEAVREPEKPWNGGRINAPKFGPERVHGAGAAGTTSKTFDVIKGANVRSVWTVATQPYPGAHFATFPPKLIEPCIKAGSSERGVCPECGRPWRRVVERLPSTSRTTGDGWQEGRSEQIASGRRGRSRPGSFTPAARPHVDPSDLDRYGTGEAGVHRKVGGQYQKWLDANPPLTTGWRQSCAHDSIPVPAVVLDPFAGSGTTGKVAQSLGRRAVLIDLNGEYLNQAMTRNADIPLGLEAS